MSLDSHRRKYFKWYEKNKNVYDLMQQSAHIFGMEETLNNVSRDLAENVDINGDPFGHGERYLNKLSMDKIMGDIEYIESILKDKQFITKTDINVLHNLITSVELNKVFYKKYKQTLKNNLRTRFDNTIFNDGTGFVYKPIYDEYFISGPQTAKKFANYQQYVSKANIPNVNVLVLSSKQKGQAKTRILMKALTDKRFGNLTGDQKKRLIVGLGTSHAIDLPNMHTYYNDVQNKRQALNDRYQRYLGNL